MKKCIVVSDSFKGTLSSLEICAIARLCFNKLDPECELVTIPVADGGEGTVDSFAEALNAERRTLTVSDPFGRPVEAQYAVKGNTAIIEMASCAGLSLVGNTPDPGRATTYGVGELILDAVKSGCTEIKLGLGGSSTNDGSCGCAAALGTVFTDSEGKVFVPTGGTLSKIAKIDNSLTQERLAGVTITLICDVDNPLYGPSGAAYTFAPQKGADAECVKFLDSELMALDARLIETFGRSFAELSGAGAAGGMGAGAVAFLGAKMQRGIDVVLDTVGFDEKLDGAELVITGEGRIDSQSVHGKVICGIAKRTAAKNIPLIALVGGIDDSADCAYSEGISAMFSINRKAEAFCESAPKSAENYRKTLEDIIRFANVLRK